MTEAEDRARLCIVLTDVGNLGLPHCNPMAMRQWAEPQCANISLSVTLLHEYRALARIPRKLHVLPSCAGSLLTYLLGHA